MRENQDRVNFIILYTHKMRALSLQQVAKNIVICALNNAVGLVLYIQEA